MNLELEALRQYVGQRCTTKCDLQVMSQYRIEYNADCIAVFHQGERIGDLVLVSKFLKDAEFSDELKAIAKQVHNLHLEGFDFGALDEVIR